MNAEADNISLADSLSILTPYLFPPGSTKVVNVGDGIILRAIERRLGRLAPNPTLSSRVAPSHEQREALIASRRTILAGANQLDDHFAPWPGLTAAELASGNYTFIPMGVGLHGDTHRNSQMSENTRQILEIIHSRLAYSSWRCPRTVAYLLKEMPHLREKTLMTGCPVLYDKPLLEASSFPVDESVIAVTATERGTFWARETKTIDFISRRFPHSRKLFVVHQDYVARKKPGLADRILGERKKTPYGLRRYAETRGFEILVPSSHDEAISLYSSATMHFGSRLHAHLHMLSQNKRSFLTEVDGRSVGIAEHFGFPLCDPAHFADHLDFDFERVRQMALRTFPVMQKFVESVHS